MKQAITINLDDLYRLAAEFVKEQPLGEQLFLSTFMIWLRNRKLDQERQQSTKGNNDNEQKTT